MEGLDADLEQIQNTITVSPWSFEPKKARRKLVRLERPGNLVRQNRSLTKRCENRRKVGRENRKNAPRLAPEVSAWE